MANEVTVWNKVMSSALAIPGVQVDRETFLRSELRQYCSKDEFQEKVSRIYFFLDVLPPFDTSI